MTLLLSLLLLPSPADTSGYVLERAEVQRIEATLKCDIHCDSLHAREWIVFAAQAPELAGQTNLKNRLRPDGLRASELSLLHRPVLTARIPASRQRRDNSVSFSATYEATLFSRRLRPLEPGEPQSSAARLSDKERKAALLERGHYDFGKADFQNWLRSEGLQRGREEADIDFASRVFQVLQAGTVYDYQPVMDRYASAVCRSKRSDCGGLSVLFVSALRANGIPARALFGRWAQSDRPGDRIGGTDYHQAHVKSEFYAEKVGWVPVDISQAVVHGRAGERSRYFGEDAGDFLALHIDPDLELDTIYFGRRTVPNLQGAVFWVTGQGSPEMTRKEEEWRVRKIR